jgi:thiamine biosynthesis protein ThiS
MQITLNGKPHQSDAGTIRQLLDQLGLHGRLAVEVNQDIVPKSEHANASAASTAMWLKSYTPSAAVKYLPP